MPIEVRHLPVKVLETTVESLRKLGFTCREDTILGSRLVECLKRINELSNKIYILIEER